MFSALFCLAAQPDLATALDSIADRGKIPGLGAMVVSADSVLWTHYHGVKKSGTETPVDESTVWHLGSCTKALTALVVCRLADQGKLDLDKPVSQVFPDFKVDDGFAAVTLRHAMAHQSGLKANLAWWRFSGDQISARRRAAAEALSQPPSSEVGKYGYSNINFVMVGVAAEQVTGKLIEESISGELGALGIKSLGFGPTGPGGAWPHKEGVPMKDWDNDNAPSMTAAGLAHMTLPDWSKFAQQMLKSLQGESDRFPKSYIDGITNNPLGGHYAMGWVIAEQPWAKGRAYWHNGSNTMNYCILWLAPAKNRAILLVGNNGSATVQKEFDQMVLQIGRSEFVQGG
ncbi:MAG: beta-lactamase family protein [Armatimonadetes bacterium]|nr:beta-lactamase family protein [Armatimonadota bacterium]